MSPYRPVPSRSAPLAAAAQRPTPWHRFVRRGWRRATRLERAGVFCEAMATICMLACLWTGHYWILLMALGTLGTIYRDLDKFARSHASNMAFGWSDTGRRLRRTHAMFRRFSGKMNRADAV